jgi:hypothetical protein
MKKLTLSFLITSIFSLWLYYLINLYDQSWTTIIRINANIYYLGFLYVSIITALTIHTNKDKKSRLILATIILINFLYIIFSFWVSNIWLNNTQWLFLIWFLILAFVSTYIRNWFWHSITILSILWIICTIGITIIPMYEIWPDIKWFEDQFSTQLIIYSKANINKTKANIKVDKKEFSISNWLSTHELKINNSWSQILFIADKKYLNTFWYILFSNKDLIQIYPQSATNINKLNNDYQLEIITGTIKNYINQEQNPQYIFTGKNMSYWIINQEHLTEILDFYDKKQKEYIMNQIWSTISENRIITNISKTIITFLAKILPWYFWKNLENFNTFQKYIDTDWFEQNLEEFNTEKINKWILKNISDALETTKIIN